MQPMSRTQSAPLLMTTQCRNPLTIPLTDKADPASLGHRCNRRADKTATMSYPAFVNEFQNTCHRWVIATAVLCLPKDSSQ